MISLLVSIEALMSVESIQVTNAYSIEQTAQREMECKALMCVCF